MNIRRERKTVAQLRSKHLLFNYWGKTDQSEIEEPESKKKAFDDLSGMREKYKRFTVQSQDVSIRNLSYEDAKNIYNIKHNMKGKDMEKALKNLSDEDAKEILKIREHASAYIRAGVIDRDLQEFLTGLC